MVQMARNAVDVIDGALLPVRYALHDRDTKFCSSFRTMLQSGGVQPILLPPQPKLECVRRAMDPLDQARVLVEVGPLW